LYVYGLHITLE